jgi:hypothetical protein
MPEDKIMRNASILETLPPGWTPIAQRSRNIDQIPQLRWSELPDAAMTILDARDLAARGRLIMANKHTPDAVVLVIKPRF